VAVTFTGTPDTSDVNSLSVGANGSANSAQNVAIRLYDEQGNVVNWVNLLRPSLCVRVPTP
jgi:type 1 fimbria pilin